MSHFLSQRWLLNRRHFLRGVGAAVALPFLDAMVPMGKVAAAEVAADKPRRSVFVYIPNGVNGMSWQVTKPGRGYELSESLTPLAKHRDDFTIFSGLHHPNGLGQAHVCADTWLTGAKIDAQSARKYENTVSCDQLMAEVTGLKTRLPSLELSISSGTGRPLNSSTLAFSAGDPRVPQARDYDPYALHLDSARPGSGALFDWTLVSEAPPGLRLIIAGGLTPDNVGDVVRACRPWGVDLSTGVESSPGRKDPVKLRAFIANAREAHSALGPGSDDDDDPLAEPVPNDV